MYAIVEVSGKQFKVANSEYLRIPLQNAEANDVLEFANVMLIDDEGKVEIGTPFVKNAVVTAHVVEHARERKIIVFKKKKRKDYKVKRGHRQGYTLIQVDSITLGQAKAAKPAETATPAAEKAAKPAAPKAAKPAAEKPASPKKAAPKKAESVEKTEKE